MHRIVALLALLAASGFAQSRPNIIFFLVDDLGYGDLGCFWQDQRASSKKFDTPALDRMAAQGAKLTHHYVSASVCAPSRASLLQGRHQGHCDVRNSQFDKALPDTHSLSSVLQAAGYRTIHIGKGGLSGAENSVNLNGTGSQNLAAHPLARGFDRFFGYLFHADGHEHYPRNGATDKAAFIYDDYQQVTNASLDLYTTDAWTAAAKKEIIDEATDGDEQPFFIYLAYDTPHFKMQRPAVAYPALNGDGNPLTGGIQWTTATDGTGKVRYASTANGTGVVDSFTHPDIPTEWAVSEKQHVGMIRRIDESIADILRTLQDLGIDDNTLCVFSSDNGPHNEGNNPRTFQSFANMEGIKRDMWEAAIRVPTIVRWPGKIAGATGNENNIHEIAYPSAQWDWMPTFCEMAGVPAPAWCDGVSLLPTLTGTGTQRDKGHLYFEFSSTGNTPDWPEFPNHRNDVKGEMQGIRIGNHMGVRTAIATGNENFRIYDVTTDPAQATNLAASLPAVQAEMKALAVTARRPGAGVSRPYDNLPLPPNGPSSVVPGVEWKSFIDATASWQWVPEFRDLAATASGTTGAPGVAVRPADDHFGLLFTGCIRIATAGSYIFYLDSDTGADFFLHDGHLIADDFNHAGSASSAAVNLSAGLHPFRLYYRHTTGTRTLSLEWSGPGISRQAVPSSAFFIEGTLPPGPPTANDDSATTSIGISVLIDVLANDFDDGTPSPLAIQSVGTPTSGTAVIESGKIRYTPPAGFTGTATFNYTITDGDATDSATVTVNVEVPAAPSRLVSYLPLDNASGITLTNGAAITSGGQGKFGEALSLDGVNDYAVVNSTPGVSGGAQRTVSAWVYQDAGSSNLRTAVALGINGTGTKWDLDIDNANAGIEVGVGGGRNAGSGLTGLTGQWMLVTSTLPVTGGNLGTVKTYLNGTVTNAGTGSTAVNTTNQAIYHLGVSANLGIQYLDGRIDDVSIWDAALTPNEIKCLFDVGNSSGLLYTAAAFDQLKQVHDAGAGSVTIFGIQWTYATRPHRPRRPDQRPWRPHACSRCDSGYRPHRPPHFRHLDQRLRLVGIHQPGPHARRRSRRRWHRQRRGELLRHRPQLLAGTGGRRKERQPVHLHPPAESNPAGDLTPRYRWSADLVDFHDDGSPDGAGTTTVTFSGPVPAGEVVSVTATVTGSVIPDRIFVRVEVTRN
jgi:arylsulfatase A-like enzyme